MISRSITTVVVIAAVVGSALLGQQRFKRESAPTAVARTPDPGYAARDAELIETGEDGRPLYRLNAATIRQHPTNGSVQLDKVRMSYRGEESSQWSLSAERGAIRENNEHIELAGDVRVVGLLSGTGGLAQILTDRLNFDTRTEVASTPDPVTFIWAGRKLEGIGLTANLKDRQVRLESNVHGRFTP